MTAFFVGMLVCGVPLGAALLWVTQAALADDLDDIDETSEQEVKTWTNL